MRYAWSREETSVGTLTASEVAIASSTRVVRSDKLAESSLYEAVVALEELEDPELEELEEPELDEPEDPELDELEDPELEELEEPELEDPVVPEEVELSVLLVPASESEDSESEELESDVSSALLLSSVLSEALSEVLSVSISVFNSASAWLRRSSISSAEEISEQPASIATSSSELASISTREAKENLEFFWLTRDVLMKTSCTIGLLCNSLTLLKT